MRSRKRAPRLFVEALESRETPSVTYIDASFESVSSGLPGGWNQWSNDGSSPFGVAATGASPAPTSGTNVLAYSPLYSSTNGLAWNEQVVDKDATISANVYLSSANPIRIVGRGSDLNTSTPTYYALTITRGLTVGLAKVVGGTATAVGTSVTSGDYVSQKWSRVTLDISGTTLRAQVQRLDNGQYLTSAGGWQAAPTWAVTATDSSIAAGDLTGIGRFATDANPLYFDDFRVEKAGGENFDGVATGALPADWSQWSSNASNPFAVSPATSGTNPIYARSAPNALAFTPLSGVSGRAWYNASQPANVTVSTDVYLNNPLDSVVFARGANLGGTTPTYYAANIRRGLTASLSKVSAGTETGIGTAVTSGDYVSQLWVTVTLDVQGSTVRMQLQRRDTNQYLTTGGGWQAAPTWAVTATDTSITAGGYTGVSRKSGNANATSFDNFVATPGQSTPPGNVVDITQTSITSPIILNQANTTYRLMNNLTATSTAFVVAAKGVTLDLNGHTVTYGTAASPTVTNGGFETGKVGDATLPANWDLTSAPTARRVAARVGMWGSYMLQMNNFTSTQTLTTSDWIPISEVGREYAATVTPRGTSNVQVEVRVLADLGSGLQTIASGFSAPSDVGRGFSAVAQFTPGVSVTQVKIQIIATLASGTSGSVDMDYVALQRSRDFGVMATQTTSVPPQLASIPGYRTTDNFTIKNGTVTQGAGKAYKGNPLFFQSLPGLKVDGVNTNASGMDTDNLWGNYASNIDIRNSTFDSTVDNISKRMVGFGAIRMMSTSGELYIGGNTILNSPMTGIYIASHNGNANTARIVNNIIRQKAFVSDGYGILINGMSNFEIGNNTIQPILGRGILFDGFNSYITKDGDIHDNIVEAYEKPNLEYGPEGLEATALRMRNYNGQHRNLVFRNNTFSARTDADGVNQAIAVRVTQDGRNGQMAGANDRFEGNTFRAIVEVTDPAKKAFAISLAAVSPGTGLQFWSNVFESNYCTLNVGDNDTQFANEDVLFASNTHRKSTLGVARTEYQTIIINTPSNGSGGFHAALDIKLINRLYEGGATSTITYTGNGQKKVGVGSLLTTNVTASGSPAQGAIVTVYDKDNQAIGTGTTDYNGRVIIPVVTTYYTQTTGSPTADPRGGFRIHTAWSSSTQQVNDPISGNTTLNFAF
jgi:hypothetical protein